MNIREQIHTLARTTAVRYLHAQVDGTPKTVDSKVCNSVPRIAAANNDKRNFVQNNFTNMTFLTQQFTLF